MDGFCPCWGLLGLREAAGSLRNSHWGEQVLVCKQHPQYLLSAPPHTQFSWLTTSLFLLPYLLPCLVQYHLLPEGTQSGPLFSSLLHVPFQ